MEVQYVTMHIHVLNIYMYACIIIHVYYVLYVCLDYMCMLLLVTVSVCVCMW